MYKVLERQKMVWVMFVLVGISFLISFAYFQPGAEFGVWVRTAATTPAVLGVLITVLGGSPAWRWLWKACPRLGEWVFPDLNGEWETMMFSNIKVIAEHHPDFVDVDKSKMKSEIPGKFTIKQNWFRIRILYDASDGYTTSRTLVVQPAWDDERDRFTLTYVYRADTTAPKKTDEQHHFGASTLTIEPSFLEMSGPYWTNRNAQKGLNTAGILRAKRVL